MFGDISAAGDMGYTTGPVLFTDITADPKPPRHANYFSVWQKQADGTWKVAVDMGVDTPQAIAPIDTQFRPAKQMGVPADKNAKAEPIELLDKQFSDSIAKTSPIKAYRARLGEEFRVHRNGIMPVVDKSGLETLTTWPTKFEFIGGKLARSNDLAFTYGKYTAPDAEEGYYVHVWRRDAAGKWRLVVDVQNPLPKENK
jgi:ketosteroid isomerase-like protein